MIQKSYPWKNPVFYLVTAGVFVVGIFTGMFLFGGNNNAPSPLREVRQRGGYTFINPLLECDTAESISKQVTPFKSELVKYVNNKISDGTINEASVYFRELNDGPWFGINEELKFVPASLLKLPLSIAYYKDEEANPGVFSKEITFTAVDERDMKLFSQTIPPEQTLQVGQQYTIKQLIDRMLIYSDNGATILLNKNIELSALANAYKDIGVDPAVIGSAGNSMTVRAYASFLRILYNASYLNKTNSEALLRILSKSEFRNGIVAGVPAGVIVAHKFGERTLPGDLLQFHDCGIVYYSSQPYLMCVMTRGEKEQNLFQFLQGISSLIYNQVDSQFHSNDSLLK